MDRWLVAQTADLTTGMVSITNGQTIHAVRGNALFIEWSVEVLNNGESADISGCTCLAYAIRPDGTTCVASGSISGSVCAVTLPQQFFALTGRVDCLMNLAHSDGTTITVAAIQFNVQRGPTDQIIAPGETYPDIAQALVALSDYMLTNASVTGVVECSKESTDPDTYGVEFDDGDTYLIVCNGSAITLQASSPLEESANTTT